MCLGTTFLLAFNCNLVLNSTIKHNASLYSCTSELLPLLLSDISKFLVGGVVLLNKAFF